MNRRFCARLCCSRSLLNINSEAGEEERENVERNLYEK